MKLKVLFLLLTCLMLITTRAWCQTSFFPFEDDFDGDNNDVTDIQDDDPVTWAPGALMDGTYDVMDGSLVMSGGDFSSVVMKGGNVVSAKDTSAQAQLTLDGDDPFGFATILSRTLQNGEGYFGGIQAVRGTIFVGELFANGNAEFIEMTTTLSPGTRDVIIQLDTIGDRITVSAWDAENGDPNLAESLSITDGTISEGGFGLWLGGNELSGVSFRSFNIVPEPSALGMLAIAVLSVLGFYRQRRLR